MTYQNTDTYQFIMNTLPNILSCKDKDHILSIYLTNASIQPMQEIYPGYSILIIVDDNFTNQELSSIINQIEDQAEERKLYPSYVYQSIHGYVDDLDILLYSKGGDIK